MLPAQVALNDFAPADGGQSLNVSYTISDSVDPAAAPFNVGIYTSPDNANPDALLWSYPVTGADLDVGTHTVSITPTAADVPGNYYLLAVADGDPTSAAFNGGVFQAANVSQQSTVYVFASGAADTVAVHAQSIGFDGQSYALDSSVTAIEVRTAGPGDSVTMDQGLTLPVSIYGGVGSDTTTNLVMDAFTVDTTGDFSVTYAIYSASGATIDPFTIGVYGSSGGPSYQSVPGV